MLKGHVFDLQTFTSEAFAITFDKVLQGRCGILKGCDLSNTSNSATIGEGYFVVKGRPLQVVGNETVSNISNNGYYSLVCEVDLSKTNTADTLNQAAIKTVYNASSYPTLTQQDITGSGTVYQYEFARFKVESGSITNFTDRRTYLDFETLYDLFEDTLENLENESQELIEQIEEALHGVLDGSAYVVNQVAETKNFSATGISGAIRRQGKIAIMEFSIGPSSSQITQIPIPSNTLKPIESQTHGFIGFKGTATNQYVGPVSVHISENYIDFTRNNNIQSGELVKGSVAYMCR